MTNKDKYYFMKSNQRAWTKEELILVINLYCRLPFGKFHKNEKEVIEMAKLIGRTPSAVGLKLGNLASFDSELQSRGIKGARHASKLDKEVWDEFFGNMEVNVFESESLRAQRMKSKVDEMDTESVIFNCKKGETHEATVKTRVNQNFFRRMIMADYEGSCCITGISQPELLVASHISPWSSDEKNRLNPRNGLALNALHDRAFDIGYITITTDYTVRISSAIRNRNSEEMQRYFFAYEGKQIRLPRKFKPDLNFLEFHSKHIFKQ